MGIGVNDVACAGGDFLNNIGAKGKVIKHYAAAARSKRFNINDGALGYAHSIIENWVNGIIDQLEGGIVERQIAVRITSVGIGINFVYRDTTFDGRIIKF